MMVELIRHGKTWANEQHLYCGSSDLALSELGKEELKVFKTQDLYKVPDLIFTSKLRRTQETAEIIFGKHLYHTMENINEIDFGIFELKSYMQLQNDPEYRNWINNIETICPTGGEQKTDFANRAVNGIKEIVTIAFSKQAEKIAIITHGGVIANTMEILCSGQKNFYEWQPSFGRGYRLSISNTFCIDDYSII